MSPIDLGLWNRACGLVSQQFQDHAEYRTVRLTYSKVAWLLIVALLPKAVIQEIYELRNVKWIFAGVLFYIQTYCPSSPLTGCGAVSFCLAAYAKDTWFGL